MKIAIIGGGASGVYLSLLLKQKYPLEDVNVYEATSKVLTKLKIAGNGKCNINNKLDNIDAYNCPHFVKKFFDKYDITTQLFELEKLGILVKELNNNCLYPISESGDNVKRILLNAANKLGVKIHIDKCFKSYEITGGRISLSFSDNETIIVDRLVFASGTHASTRDDKSHIVFNELDRHGYTIKELRPALCPIYVNENVKALNGNRIKASVLTNNLEENGEVLFKKDGLSGIAIFNASLTFARKKAQKGEILLKTMVEEDLDGLARVSSNFDDPLLTIYPLEVANYVYRLAGNKKDFASLKRVINSGLRFTYAGNYDASNAHICAGGVSLENINDDTLESKLEKHVFFLGEMMDVDGYCGGFNLKWALVSALNVRDNIKK